MGRTQKLAAIIKEGVRNPQKIKKGLKVLKNQGPEIFKQRLSASVNYEPGYGRVKKSSVQKDPLERKIKKLWWRDSFFHCNACI